MKGTKAEELQSGFPFAHHPNLRVSVEDFGPIRNGSVDIRPLTIFVGPSNTGKTYLATLIYAFFNATNGLLRFPVSEPYHSFLKDEISLSNVEIQRLADILSDEENSLLFSDLPERIRSTLKDTLIDKSRFAKSLKLELERCFDLDHASDLIGATKKSNGAKLSVSVGTADREFWNFAMKISQSGISSGGNINDFEILPKKEFDREIIHRSHLREVVLEYIKSTNFSETRNRLEAGQILRSFAFILNQQRAACHFLPAARTGIMQSHRIIASSLVSLSTRAGLVEFPKLPTLSGVTADFLRSLILYDSYGTNLGNRSRRSRSNAFNTLADDMEQRTLGGKIIAKKSNGSYPEFVYRPLDSKKEIRLSRTSSMVSELAPVILAVRGNIESGDLLIFEEPEAHLHPAAQTEIAIILARLVRCGVQVVVTTHSDWFLKEIGNLIRQGELEKISPKNTNEFSSSSCLTPKDVGIWLFQNQGAGTGSKIRKIKFDRVEGIEPSDYEDVAEKLYNRSAELQNRLAEADTQEKA